MIGAPPLGKFGVVIWCVFLDFLGSKNQHPIPTLPGCRGPIRIACALVCRYPTQHYTDRVSLLEGLCLNSEDIIKMARQTACRSDCVLCKLDLKDFHRDGDHEELVRADVAKFGGKPRAELVKDTLERMLF